MIRSFVGALGACMLLVVALPARAATDYTDTWWATAEPGWGVNLTQQQETMYATFYVYGADGRSTWYAALLTRDGTGERFTGTLSRTTGTYFALPWQGYTIAPAGTATFTATSSTAGTLAYTADGVNVTKEIARITLAALNVAGTYIGGVSGRRSVGCNPSGPIIDPVQIQILHSTLDRTIRIDQISLSGQLVCRMAGLAVQSGKVLTVDNASYSCGTSWNAPARIFNLRPTPAGFEGQWVSNAGNGCTESGQFSGVTQSP